MAQEKKIDDIDDDIDTLDLTGCRDRITELQADRLRQQEYTERLQEKLKALNNELAARKEEEERHKKKLTDEQQSNRRGEEGLLAEQKKEDDDGARQDQVRLFIEEMLHQKVPKNQIRTKDGFKIFDETDLMVDKPKLVQAKEQAVVDTVQVIYFVPNTDLKYSLTYRVEPEAISRALREDACSYWNLSEVMYILRSPTDFAKVHDELKIKKCFREKEEAKLHLVEKTPKNSYVGKEEQSACRAKSGPLKMQARRQNNDSAETKQDDSGKYPLGKDQNKPLAQLLRVVPGLWEFMTQRDQHVIQHTKRIKLQTIVAFLAFFILTLYHYHIRQPPNIEYYLRNGPVTLLTQSRVDSVSGTDLPAFAEIQSKDDAWNWLYYSLPDQLMMNTSMLRRFNYLPGFLQIRMQKVMPRKVTADKTIIDDLSCTTQPCYHSWYELLTAEEKPLANLQSLYWQEINVTAYDGNLTDVEVRNFVMGVESQLAGKQGSQVQSIMNHIQQLKSLVVIRTRDDRILEQSYDVTLKARAIHNSLKLMVGANATIAGVAGTQGRGPGSPWAFRKAIDMETEHGLGTEPGQIQRWDASGYAAEYQLSYSSISVLKRSYQDDLAELRFRGWEDGNVRAIHVGFDLYNGNYDYWISCLFTLEFYTNSVVLPTFQMRPYKVAYHEYREIDGSIFMIDVVRGAIVIYILTFHFYLQLKYEGKYFGLGKGKAAIKYLFFTPMGIVDWLVVCIFGGIFILRYVIFSNSSTEHLKLLAAKYTSFLTMAYWYRFGELMEAVLTMLVVLRLLSLLTINRQLFILWRTIGKAAGKAVYFLWIFIPVLLGFTMISHSIWGSYHQIFSSFHQSLTSLLMMLIGDLDVVTLQDHARPWTSIFILVFILLCILLVVNGWVAEFVHVYQSTRIECGYDPKEYAWKEHQYATWILFLPLANLYFDYVRPKIERPKRAGEDDDEEG